MRHPHLRCAAFLLFGLALASAAFAQVNGTISFNSERLQGTDAEGRLLLFAPDPVQPGSSISHWDPSTTPNLLMEPSINSDLAFLDLDITPSQMQDIGWELGTSTFNITNLDPQGVGFTDATPFAGAPGNPATTLGEARINLFNAVLAAWANTLQSTVDINVDVTWQPLPCQAGLGAVLAGAATILIFQDPSFPFPNTWYHSALAEAMAGQNLSDPNGDIFVVVNSDIDNGCLGPGTSYYYGIDGQNPSNQVDLGPVVLHEVGHGLGFANFTNETTGQLIQDTPGIYDRFTFDITQNRSWAQMTDAQRVMSAINSRHVVWTGPLTTAEAENFLDAGQTELSVTSPPEVAGTYDVGLAQFGPSFVDMPIGGEIICMEDAADQGGTSLDGCTAATNADELAGKIALINRGQCDFTDKVLNAQAAGAIGAIIVNNAGNAPFGVGGDVTLPINIPTASIGRGDGNLIRQAACSDDAVFLNGGRFQVTANWATGSDSGPAVPFRLTDDTGYFSFFNPDNVELVVKVLDACNIDGFNNFWVFAGGLTNVEVELTVTDTVSGEVKTYSNPLGTPFQPIQDTAAFATCP